jgi:glutamine cyclotransferase
MEIAPVFRLLLTIVTLLQAGAMAAAQEATPTPGVACAVAPREVEALLALWFDPTGATRVTGFTTHDLEALALDPARGEPAGAAVTSAVGDVAREWVACLDAGDQRRAHALLTDAYVTERGFPAGSRDEARAELEASPSPVAPEAMRSIGPAVDARRFPDGRVGASFAVTGLRQPGESVTLFVLFARIGDEWRIDGMAELIAPRPLAPVWGYRVLAGFPHDVNAYTQGLVLIDGTLYEGTGVRGDSELRRVDIGTGMVQQWRALDEEHFGEGIVVFGDRIYQLTWRSGTCFVYDRETFDVVRAFVYDGEGWGLTTDGERLIMSDGGSRLTFRDPETFAETGSVEVRDGGLPVRYLNELEYVDGEVWANVYTTDRIVRIDPATGEVTGWIDLTGLLPAGSPRAEGAGVLNGIAWDPQTGRLLVTGKNWPLLFEIELVPPA